ncbi:TonB-dependent receptor plug domain-containing protein [Flavitalea sp.]|nr:TonB-dependent receptor plug domain-containing protein [Flavitalea sp.]
MPFLIQYLIKLSVSLAVVYLFYRFILRPLTFYAWNRWYLVGYSLIAFVMPFIDINPILNSIGPDQAMVINFIPVIDPAALENKGWFNINNRWNWILAAILCGMLVMLIRLVAQFFSYRKLRNSATLLSDTPVKIFQVDKNIVPFSFGNSIFINREQHGEQEMQEIIRHEFIHVKQKHTADMIWAEALCIINWYNPFAWLIKKVICQNLEFIADQQVLENGLDKKEYQYLLLKVAGGSSFRITNQFNFSFLRKRIAMMNKMKSAKLHLVKFLFVLPLMAVLLLSFREKIEGMLDNGPDNKSQNKSAAPLLVDVTNHKADTVPNKIELDSVTNKSVVPGINWKDQSLFSIKSKNHPLFIVDEIIKDEDYVQALDPNSISSIEVLKNEHALQYGDKGKNGVVRIYTKPNYYGEGKRSERLVLSDTPKKQVRLRNSRDSITLEADVIYIDNGKQLYSGKDSVYFDSKQLYYTAKDSVIIDASLDKYKAPGVIRMRGNPSNPVVLIDGVRQPRGTDLRNLDPNSIESISVLKDNSAVETYGAEAVNGVLLINTKLNLNDSGKPAGLNGARVGGAKGVGSIKNNEIKLNDTVPVKSEPGRNRQTN